MSRPSDLASVTPDATAQVAQQQSSVAPAPAAAAGTAEAGDGLRIGAAVTRAARVGPYERRSDDPLYRLLRIYTGDPSKPRLQGAVALLKVPYEPLEPGPIGALVEVDNYNPVEGVRYARADLDDRKTLILNGRDPSPSDPMFHQQMVYAVASSVHAAFQGALGRNLAWGFDAPAGGGAADEKPRLLLRPHALRGRNAYYVKEAGEIRFGYFQARESVLGRNPPGGFVFTCLSHDIIAHEFAHALLDGLRGNFTSITRPDVAAFHEAFADLVAIFQHFTYKEVVLAGIRQSAGQLERASVLAAVASQFGYALFDRPLRTAIDVLDPAAQPQVYDPKLEIHALGSVLVSAVFEAFTTVFHRKTERFFRLASDGTGVMRPGQLPPDLQEILAEQAAKLASQVLSICIRAVDYCPPVDLELGDYLRGMITADAELVPDDPWAYREALVDAFARRGIFPRGLRNVAEDSLRWSPPWKPIAMPDLSFAQLRFAGDPGRAADADELRRQAITLGRVVSANREAFGLVENGDPRLGGDAIGPVTVESIRSARRVGPDGQVLFDLVAEVTQTRTVPLADGRKMPFVGGATVIIDPKGGTRYAITKSVLSPQRLEEQRAFVTSDAGKGFWAPTDGNALAPASPFAAMHGEVVDATTDARPTP